MKFILAALLFFTLCDTASAGKIVLWVVLGPDQESQAIQSQWARQYADDEKSIMWACVFEDEFTYIHKHFDVRLIDRQDIQDTVLPPTPFYKVGRDIQRFRDGATCPCGCFIKSLHYICKDYRYELTTEFKQWSRNGCWVLADAEEVYDEDVLILAETDEYYEDSEDWCCGCVPGEPPRPKPFPPLERP